MKDLINQIRYLPSHEWGRIDEIGILTVGISDHAQDLLGDIVFIELPEVGKEVEAEGDAAIVESVKAASDVYTPISGEIIEVNSALEEQPETVNGSPYDDGWFFKVKPINVDEMSDLLSPEEYSEVCED